MRRTLFNDIAFHASREILKKMFRIYARPLFYMDQEAREKRVDGALRIIDTIGDRCPDLAVTWASMLLFHTKHNHHQQEQAVACIAHHLPDAYALDPHGAKQAALMVHLGVNDRNLRVWVQQRLYEADPVLQPGPWGLRPAGMRQLDANREASRSPWNRWAEQLGDLKHRILYPPGPDDITIPGVGWDDDKPPSGDLPGAGPSP